MAWPYDIVMEQPTSTDLSSATDLVPADAQVVVTEGVATDLIETETPDVQVMEEKLPAECHYG